MLMLCHCTAYTSTDGQTRHTHSKALDMVRVEFKLAVLVYKALNNLAPPYLSDDCQLVATTGRAPSASTIRQFQVHRY